MSNPQLEAAKTVGELLKKHYGFPLDDQARNTEQDFIRDVVEQLGRRMRPVAEEQVRSSGWISPDECRERSLRMVNAGIADYCRNLRLTIATIVEQKISTPENIVDGICLHLAMAEAHYARLAKMSTHEEAERVWMDAVPMPEEVR